MPVAGLHVDLVRAPQQLDNVLAQLPAEKIFSLGVINGRNIWRSDLDKPIGANSTGGLCIGYRSHPNCTQLLADVQPSRLGSRNRLDPELNSWLAFARQKLDELTLLKQAANQGVEAVAEPFTARREALKAAASSPRTHNLQVRERLDSIDGSMLRRDNNYKTRKAVQAQRLSLPALPTTTIGSFPQTQEVRAQSAAKNNGALTQAEYDEFLKAEIARTIQLQEEIGLDVLVHGEFERTDMVEYFGEQMTGIAFTQHGWVQSYGSRGVRPPIIYGDVARPAPMTVSWSVYAQSLTSKPVKGMFTGRSRSWSGRSCVMTSRVR